MGIETQTFIRKPLYVEAVRVTPQNFDDMVVWCQGEVMQDDVPGRGRSKKYIKVDVHNPKNPRQTKAKIGDWILKTEKGYKIYTDKAFHESFHLPEADHRPVPSFGSTPEAVQLEAQRNAGLISEEAEVVPGVTVGEAMRMLRSHADLQTAVGPDVELVPATPQGIAEAVEENEKARAQEIVPATPETISQVVSAQVPVKEGRVDATVTEEKIAEAVEPLQGGSLAEEPTIEVDGGVHVNDSSSAPPPVHNGKRVLTLQEQGEMDSDEIRELIKSGEVVLAQDVAT